MEHAVFLTPPYSLTDTYTNKHTVTKTMYPGREFELLKKQMEEKDDRQIQDTPVS